MSKIIYDEHYKKEGYFGKPYPELVDFFRSIESDRTVLDLGCGQGRDLFFLADQGFNLIGVDHSKVGIDQIAEKAKKLGLKIRLEVADVYDYKIPEDVDIVLLDSMLHFYKREIDKEIGFVTSILNQLKTGAFFCNCLMKGREREKVLKDVIDQSQFEWETLHEEYASYPESNAKYHFIVIKKGGEKYEEKLYGGTSN